MPRHPHEVSVVGTGTRITGRISGSGALRIEGRVKGDVNVNGDTEIAEGASVEGNLNGESLDIAGSLLGDARAGAIAVRNCATCYAVSCAAREFRSRPARGFRCDSRPTELDFGTAQKRR